MDIDVAPILDPLREIESRGYNRYNVFRDWVDLMLYALQRRDDPYLEILEGYDQKRDYEQGNRAADLFTEAFGELQRRMQETNLELLGVCYEAFGMNSDAFGQHFTPHSACRTMAEMQAGHGDPDPPITIADPAAGSGRLLVFAARQHDVQTISFGMDKDLLCAQMCALNFCFFNMDGVVVYGNSLSMDKHRAWQTRHTIAGGEVAEADPEDVPWPEAALEANAERDEDAAVDATPDTAAEAADRVTVETDGAGADQAGLDEWLD